MKKILLITLFSGACLMSFDAGRAVLAGFIAELSGQQSVSEAKVIKFYLDEKMR